MISPNGYICVFYPYYWQCTLDQNKWHCPVIRKWSDAKLNAAEDTEVMALVLVWWILVQQNEQEFKSGFLSRYS